MSIGRMMTGRDGRNISRPLLDRPNHRSTLTLPKQLLGPIPLSCSRRTA